MDFLKVIGGVRNDPMVSLITYRGPLNYSRRNGDIYDPGEVNFVFTPEYPHTASEKGRDEIRKTYHARKQ